MGVQVFTSDGTFTWPAGVTTAVVECWGPGGAGGTGTEGKGGGGGGAYARALVTKTNSTATVNVGTASFDSTYFLQGGTINCLGAYGGDASTRTGGTGGTTGSSTGDFKFAGASGGTSTGTNAGGGGGGAGASGRIASAAVVGTSNSGATGGTGGIGHWGGSGGNGGNNGIAGANATGFGGGGGGGGKSAASGTGTAGRVVVSWQVSTDPPSSLRFAAGVCCPTICPVPKLNLVNDAGNRTRYPTSATLTISGTFTWFRSPGGHDPDTSGTDQPECSCTSALSGKSFVLSFQGTDSGHNAIYIEGVTGTPALHHAIGTTNDLASFTQPADADYSFPNIDGSGNWFCDPDFAPEGDVSFNPKVVIGFGSPSSETSLISANVSLLGGGPLGVANGVFQFSETEPVIRDYKLFDSTCNSGEVWVVQDSYVLTTPDSVIDHSGDLGNSLVCSRSTVAWLNWTGVTATIDFDDFIETPFAGRDATLTDP